MSGPDCPKCGIHCGLCMCSEETKAVSDKRYTSQIVEHWDGVIQAEHHVLCSRCRFREDNALATTKTGFARELRGAGWVMRQGLWVCPDCVEEL